MENKGLLFIPDISGFTKFINKTEIDHSRHIIQELLEGLINSNILNLKISEIEGDAILFYRFGSLPSLKDIYRQVETMFCNFHKQLNRYANHRICPCNACRQAKDLTLKVITHEGEFSTYTVREFNKLIGKDVITAHRLLKNDIPDHEYWLVTNGVFTDNSNSQNLPEWLQWRQGKKSEDEGDIDFKYSHLTPLKENLPADNSNEFGIQGPKVLMIAVQREMDVNIEALFSVVADLSLRSKWTEGVNAVENISSPINQVGTEHHCIVGKNVNVLITSGFNKDEHSIVLEETDKKRTGTAQMKLEKLAENKTLMTFNFFLKKNPVLILFFKLFMRKKFTQALKKSLENLEAYMAKQNVAA